MRDIEETLANRSEKEDSMRCLFDHTRMDLEKLLREQLTDFCMRRTTGAPLADI